MKIKQKAQSMTEEQLLLRQSGRVSGRTQDLNNTEVSTQQRPVAEAQGTATPRPRDTMNLMT